jgi:hypothetical protein
MIRLSIRFQSPGLRCCVVQQVVRGDPKGHHEKPNKTTRHNPKAGILNDTALTTQKLVQPPLVIIYLRQQQLVMR